VNRRSTNHLSAQADSSGSEVTTTFTKALSSFFATVAISASLFHGGIQMAYAEDELAAKYGGGLDTSLVDQTCLVDRCSLQAKVSRFNHCKFCRVVEIYFPRIYVGGRKQAREHPSHHLFFNHTI